MLGGSTDFLELYWLWKPFCLGCSWWFSPCHVLLLGHSLQGLTSISLLQLYKGFTWVPHWWLVVAPITCNFIGCFEPCLGQSWWFSPCHIMLLSPFLQQPTSFSLLQLYRGYICVPHWCWVVALIYWNFIGSENLVVWAAHGDFHPVTSCYMALPSRDPPKFLCFNYKKAIFVFHIGVWW